MFGGAGWLFADLMLALAVAFLVADTVGTTPPGPPKATRSSPAAHPTSSPTRTPTPTPTPSASPSGPALDFHFITVYLTVDPAGLRAGSAQAKASVDAQIARVSGLTGRRAGLVLLFAGAQDLTGTASAKSLNQVLAGVLPSLSINGGQVFQVAVYRTDLVNYGRAANTVQLDIYLFKQ
jgi:hypothetical protein